MGQPGSITLHMMPYEAASEMGGPHIKPYEEPYNVLHIVLHHCTLIHSECHFLSIWAHCITHPFLIGELMMTNITAELTFHQPSWSISALLTHTAVCTDFVFSPLAHRHPKCQMPYYSMITLVNSPFIGDKIQPCSRSTKVPYPHHNWPSSYHL